MLRYRRGCCQRKLSVPATGGTLGTMPYEAKRCNIMKIVNQELQAALQALIAQLPAGESVTISPEQTGTQWSYTFTASEKDGKRRVDARIHNTSDGIDWFYAADTEPHKFGAPIVIEEPSLRVPCTDAGITEQTGFLVGAVAFGVGNSTLRASWSNLVKVQKKQFGFKPDRSFWLGDELIGYVWAIVLANKNRIDGYVAVVRPESPIGPVWVLELEDVVREAVLQDALRLNV